MAVRGRRVPAPRARHAVLLAGALAARGAADARLFADLGPEDLEPRPFELCQLEPVSRCLTEFHVGRFDGSQMHRSMDAEKEALELLRPPHARLLLLFTSVWRNFQRRRLVRQALGVCRHFVDPRSVVWRFLLGEAPSWLVRRAMAESAAHEDMLLLGGPDEMRYQHFGDAYELHQANPELTKIVLAIRLFLGTLRFDYLLVADDDSFVNIASAIELLDLLPKDRVYVGNMIDTVPQRWDEEKRQVRAEFSVNMYLSAPSKVPVFAHGMGFLLSHDVAHLLGDVGLSLKSRGNDDMLMGVWLRSVEHLYYLHYWPMFIDHEEYGSPFSRPCDVTSVVVHRMTPERWRHFVPTECHLCGPASRPLDTEDDPPARPGPEQEADRGAAGGPAFTSCPRPEHLACPWRPSKELVAGGKAACAQECRREARLNSSHVACPMSVCHALCQPPGPRNTLCPETPVGRGPKRARPRPPQLAICVFGSAWADWRLRGKLRSALRSCAAERLAVHNLPHVFMMGPLPSVGDPLRQVAVKEVLVQRDLAILRPLSTVRGSEKRDNVTYAYAEAWRVVEERFGAADFLLFLDHRSFVNVPYLLHAILPELPTERIYIGCLVEERLFSGKCTGGGSRCDYLRRRRSPLFAHGMGFVVSKDVAQFVSSMAARVALRSNDIPADVAFGMWVQPLEDLIYETAHTQIHEWPSDGRSDTGVAGGDLGFSQEISGSSMIVFPMTVERWEWFDPQSCSLQPPWLRVQASPVAKATPVPTGPPAGPPDAEAVPVEACWEGMGARAEAWYLVCCEIGWSSCWGGKFTAATCCAQAPQSAGTARPALDSAAGVEALRHFLGFRPSELQQFFLGLSNVSALLPLPDEPTLLDAPAPAPPAPLLKLEGPPRRFPCLTPRDCVHEAFARLYQQLWRYGALPLRHPWIMKLSDHLIGVAHKYREENDGWGPRGHEFTIERVQVARWLQMCAERIPPEAVPGERRCLEWDSTEYSRRFFSRHCSVMDVLAFDGLKKNKVFHFPGGDRRFVADLHTADDVIPENSTGLVTCTQIFEHLRRPHLAMAQLFRLLAPGGFVVWSAPMFSERHGAPEDYWRYTLHGAAVLAVDAGFEVLHTYAPGSLEELAGYLLGMTVPYWDREELLRDKNTNWPLQVYMLLQKPL